MMRQSSFFAVLAAFLLAATPYSTLADDAGDCQLQTTHEATNTTSEVQQLSESQQEYWGIATDLQISQRAYWDYVAGVIQEDCLDSGTGAVQSCNIDLRGVNSQSEYAMDCTGSLWGCRYEPQCGRDTVLRMDPVLICTTSNCTSGSEVSILLPHDTLLQPLREAGHQCAVIFSCSPSQ